MHARYLKWLLLFFCLSLLPAELLNIMLIIHTSNVQKRSIEASEWQHRTHGITFTPTSGSNGLFKSLRLNDRRREIDTVIFGSSTAMTIDSGMLPACWRLYNFAQSGHPLAASIGEAEYLLHNDLQIKHFLITLDWSLGFPYDAGEPVAADLSAVALRKESQTVDVSPAFMVLLREALSYPRMEQLGKILKEIFKSPQPGKTFREYFLQQSSDDYVCPDGVPGKDFDIYDRGTCNGFRHDGSATFSSYLRVNNARQLLMAETATNSKYVQNLLKTKGRLNSGFLEHLVALHVKLQERGGELILLLPPLLPGFEQAFLHHPQYSKLLQTTKDTLGEWAQREQITLFDAGQSERYGCSSEEFLDVHHATSSCYQKIFASFWQNVRLPDGSLRPGIIH